MRKQSHSLSSTIASGALVALVLGVGLLVYVGYQSFDPVQRQRREQAAQHERMTMLLEQQERAAALARQQHLATALAPVDVAAGAIYRLLPVLVLVGACWYAVDRYRLARRVVRPDARGLLPLPRLEIEHDSTIARAALAAYHTTALAAAERPNVPHTVSITSKDSAARALPAQDSTEDTLLPAYTVPTFRDLIGNGTISRGSALVLGVAADGLVRGSWSDLYSAAIAGVSGSGKTTTVRFTACQAALHGARFAILDKHGDSGNEDSLAVTLAPLERHMLCAPASSDQDVLSTLALIRQIGSDREAGRDQSRSPILLCVDEFTGYMKQETIADELGALLEKIAQEYRKFGVYAMISGQIWTAKRTGGSELRDSLASAYIHRIRPDQARYLSGLSRGDLPNLQRLSKGSAYLYQTSGEIKEITIPNTTAADVEHVAALLDTPSTLPSGIHTPALQAPAALERMPEHMPTVCREYATADAAYSASASATTLTAETLRIGRLFFDDALDTSTIVKEVYNVSSNQGTRYQQHLKDVQAHLRQYAACKG